jgi:hypothetical protein
MRSLTDFIAWSRRVSRSSAAWVRIHSVTAASKQESAARTTNAARRDRWAAGPLSRRATAGVSVSVQRARFCR